MNTILGNDSQVSLSTSYLKNWLEFGKPIVNWTPAVFVALFPGLPWLQFLLACNMEKTKQTKLEPVPRPSPVPVFEYWRQQRPGNEATCLH